MKAAIIIDEELPGGLKANTAAVIGISLGAMFPAIVREPAYDAGGNEYAGITSLVIPVLSADEAKLKDIALKVSMDEELTMIPFTRTAQRSKEYDSYKADLLRVKPEEVSFSGIALVGSGKKVSGYTGSLPLLR